MDARNFPPAIKAKCREVFDSRVTWRALYQPIGTTTVDINWWYAMPKFGQMLVGFLENILYQPTGHEEYLLRSSVRNSNTPEEMITWKPWSQLVEEMQVELARSVETITPTTPLKEPGEERPEYVSTDEWEGALTREGQAPSRHVSNSANALERKLVRFLVEPTSGTALTSALHDCNLATIMPSDGQRFLVLIDCNTFGEPDSQPQHRVCPMSSDVFNKWLKSLKDARYGEEKPLLCLPASDLFMCINAGKDRKRMFSKALILEKSGKYPQRTQVLITMVHLEESAWRARHNSTGRSRVKQEMYLGGNAAALKTLPKRQLPTLTGSIKCDVCGPGVLDPITSIPKLSKDDKILIWASASSVVGAKETQMMMSQPMLILSMWI